MATSPHHSFIQSLNKHLWEPPLPWACSAPWDALVRGTDTTLVLPERKLPSGPGPQQMEHQKLNCQKQNDQTDKEMSSWAPQGVSPRWAGGGGETTLSWGEGGEVPVPHVAAGSRSAAGGETHSQQVPGEPSMSRGCPGSFRL